MDQTIISAWSAAVSLSLSKEISFLCGGIAENAMPPVCFVRCSEIFVPCYSSRGFGCRRRGPSISRGHRNLNVSLAVFFGMAIAAFAGSEYTGREMKQVQPSPARNVMRTRNGTSVFGGRTRLPGLRGIALAERLPTMKLSLEPTIVPWVTTTLGEEALI